MHQTINFSKIRGDNAEGQRSFFEQVFCHLANLDGGGGVFRRIEGVGGDGGVEALRLLSTGKKVGYQAKFHLSVGEIDWSKVDKSVETALTQHPELERYVIAIPCDFTGKRAARGGTTEGAWGKWDKQVERWKLMASEHRMTLEFVLWTAFDIETALLQPEAQHLIPFFFDLQVFTRSWMQRHLHRTIFDLQARYSPGEHVDTDSLMPFDVIFRRENVCHALRSVFDIARYSDPRSAVALVTDTGVSEADIVAAEGSLKEFVELSESVDWPTARPWPICRWFTSWYYTTRQLSGINSAIIDRIQSKNEADFDSLHHRVSETTKVHRLIEQEVFGGPWAYLLPIDGSRATLLVGRAGAGKSHILARGAETAWDSGAPVIHILGQHILDGDPRLSILKRLEISNWTFNDMLSALNLAAEAAGTRALLMIDALNEGRGMDVWRNHLASFLKEINRHDRVVLVLSCREEYLDYVVDSELIAVSNPYPNKNGQPPNDCAPLGKLVRVSVNGFRTSEEREAALQKFMDDKEIARPTAPVLDAEFFNPLFLSSVCRSMAKAGIKVFPRGLHGTREIFKYVFETKAKALGTRYDCGKPVLNALRSALQELAGCMVARKEDNVPINEAMDVVNSAFKALPLKDQTWMEVLEGSDFLRRDVEGEMPCIGTWSKPNEVVRFSFQRLQDNLIADRLVRDCQDIEAAFEKNGPFSFLLIRSIRKSDHVHVIKPSPRWVGVIGALWSAVAEIYGREIWDLKSFFGNPEVHFYQKDFRPIFAASIRERTGKAFTKRTKEILDKLWADDQEEKLGIILSTSCVPNHLWGADFLSTRLLSMSLPDRDSVWSRWFTSAPPKFADRKVADRALEITDWALNVDANSADEEVVRLAGITLTMLLTLTNRRIRDRATKALVNLLIGQTKLFPYLINRFHSIDDPYVLERLLAAGYGAICLDPMEERIEAAARIIADTIFAGMEPPIHLSIHHWSRLIMKCAVERDLVSANIFSPPRSAFAELNVTLDELTKIAEEAKDETIVRSCQHFNDFYDYIIKPHISYFSETPLNEPPPLTQEEKAARFIEIVHKLGGNPMDRLNEVLEAANTASNQEIPVITISESPFSVSIMTKECDKLNNAALLAVEGRFISSLPEKLASDYKTELAPRVHRQFEPLQTRNPEPVGLWIAKRAYELGWTKDRFPDEPRGGDTSRPVIERIGKKYQWIALEEMMARLADNFWLKAEYCNDKQLYHCQRDMWHLDRIDPTILPFRNRPPHYWPKFIGPPLLILDDVDDIGLENWPFHGDHFNDPRPWLSGISDGREYLIAEWTESLNEKIQNPYPIFRRQIQAFVSLVAHKAGDRQLVVDGFLSKHDRGINGWSLKIECDRYLVHEIGILSPEVIPFWRQTEYDNSIEIASPIVTGFIANDTDRSIEENVRYIVPHPSIRHALDLCMPDSRNTCLWQLPDGQVFLRKSEDRGSPLLLDKELFDAWCLSEQIEYTWVYIGERRALKNQHTGKCRRTIGVAWFEDGEVKFKSDQRDE